MATWLCPCNMAVIFLVLSSLFLASVANKPPQIRMGIPFTGKEGVLNLSEDTPLNSYLAIMEAIDNDADSAGEVVCVTDNPYISIPLVYPKTYKVELSRELDRETVNIVQVSILCSDKGVPSMTSTAMFTINIIDINDNAPTFAKSVYNANVTEGAAVGTLVTRVKATDPDAEKNGAVEYFLFSDPLSYSNHFSIDKDTGKLFTKMNIDREVISQYVLTIVAKDSGLPAKSSSVEVRIEVDDVNDNVPQIVTKELHVKENQRQMAYVGTLLANDSDIGKNSELVFSKMENSESSSTAPFLIQPNGEVLSVVSLDREQRHEYTMEVAVRDKGNPRLSSTASITIFVDDVNDNAPIVTSACLDDYNGDLPYGNYAAGSNTSNGIVSIDWYSTDDKRIVYKIVAVDDDSEGNGKLLYAIESAFNSDSSNATIIKDPLFQINSSTGEISLRRFVGTSDYLAQILNISVTDSGNPPLVAFCLLNITIDVDVSLLTTPKATSYKTRPNIKATSTTNTAPRAFVANGLSVTSHLSASLPVLLLWCYIIHFLHS